MASTPLTREQAAIARDILEVGDSLTSSYRLALYGGTRPASKEAIEALKEVDGCDNVDDHRECAICLNLLLAEKKKQAPKEMPCGHRFHGGCLGKWLRVKGTCPTCRHQLLPALEMTRAERVDALERWLAVGQEFLERRRMHHSNTAV